MQIRIELAQQTLTLCDDCGNTVQVYPVSTAQRGAGEQNGSLQTPRGLHVVRAKIGAGLPAGAVLKGRRATGEIADAQLVAQHPQRDWILSRILWLSGCQAGLNRLGQCDTMARYIYIHGTPDSEPMGVPQSHGCIRMRNRDVIDLFERIAVGCRVLIIPEDEPAPQTVMLNGQQVRSVLSRLGQSYSEQDARAQHWVSWNWQGEVLAYARLHREGWLDKLRVYQDDLISSLTTELIQTIKAEAANKGWYELRALVADGEQSIYQRAGFSTRSDVCEHQAVAQQMLGCSLR